ncbi:cytoplasm to vacuole targeting Vps64 [Metarhizium album ARSEF 1941]|uniref:Cytoplasm to vacuole targeting Vps64 n=1 Tax=Metarhizium album (strain ARSEF 1941) TaxID=1081103 RepID=A0A0B2X749_METAS|nr:cytoplasm to vacuole targeting Vps64 [Metarhizium album ARSEF 1941]KHO01290.1 cytoplasm to vacuole targeting Vps64 [Metarhizium album ARSEF 1941]
MTAVASPPTFPQISRPAWGAISGSNPMDPDEVRGMFAPRKSLSRTNSASSLSSNASNTSVATNGSQSNGTSLSAASDLSQWSATAGPRKRPQPKAWPPSKPDVQPDYSRLPASRPNSMAAHHNGIQPGSGQSQLMQQQQMMRGPIGAEQYPPGQPVLYLLSLNGTFERKTIAVPFAPDTLRIGRQTNQKTIPTSTNGFFDSKVLSRQHAEIYAERNGKIYIRDVKSSNGTFVNGTRLSQENRESEPHELQTADHLELGIDIVSEDQKTVVHHKVAAKVEHAGFLSNTNNVLDMNFGDLDPANGTMMIPNGPLQMRGRANVNALMPNTGGRMLNNGGMNNQGNGMVPQRTFFPAPIATDQILKRLTLTILEKAEVRNAQLQGQDLSRTNQFVKTLLTKDDVKDLEKPEAPEPAKQQQQPQPPVNGGILFRPDAKTRFSEPPAPPPQQPLPEKPDVPSLKRGPTERPKPGPPNSAVVRQENLNQIIQLTEALNNAKRDMDTQIARMRELEEMLQKEREARELAEDLANRLEASANSQLNGFVVAPTDVAVTDVSEAAQDQVTEKSEDPPPIPEESESRKDETAVSEVVASLQSRIDNMDEQMKDMRGQVEQWKHRCESAESERDESRKSLAEMVCQLRAEEAKRSAAEERRRSRSKSRVVESRADVTEQTSPVRTRGSPETPDQVNCPTDTHKADMEDGPALSRANTITPLSSQRVLASRDQSLQAGLPYASMIGVVLIGMGLMAYINGWQSPPPRIER